MSSAHPFDAEVRCADGGVAADPAAVLCPNFHVRALIPLLCVQTGSGLSPGRLRMVCLAPPVFCVSVFHPRGPDAAAACRCALRCRPPPLPHAMAADALSVCCMHPAPQSRCIPCKHQRSQGYGKGGGAVGGQDAEAVQREHDMLCPRTGRASFLAGSGAGQDRGEWVEAS